ncbi:MAG: hypothetical protein Q9190_005213 [Brigantiaea leucoxantha]
MATPSSSPPTSVQTAIHDPPNGVLPNGTSSTVNGNLNGNLQDENVSQYLSQEIRQLSLSRSSSALRREQQPQPPQARRTSLRNISNSSGPTTGLSGVETERRNLAATAHLMRPRTDWDPQAQEEQFEAEMALKAAARAKEREAKKKDRVEVGDVGWKIEPEEAVGRWQVRHGWEEQYSSDEYLRLLSALEFADRSKTFYMYFTDKRHETGGKPRTEDLGQFSEEWRMRDRMKTVSAALLLCLNIGVDPPDMVKTKPTAKLECWVDPTSPTAVTSKTMETIGKKLQEQYESLSMRVRFKQYLDPSIDETKKFCTSLRKNAKDERIMFHYNGHGVPLPTSSGEIWVFNRNYTQYIPVSLYDLQAWLGAPSVYIFDCSHAGNILLNFERFVEKHEEENAARKLKEPDAQLQTYRDNIQLAACSKSEYLPTNPDLPADLFTCCITTPIEISLRCFHLSNPLPSSLKLEDLKRVPGKLQERRSPLGELNWIFTAITDTIAWNLLPRATFKKLFRQDLLVAALFRNFLLAERLMRANGCHPKTVPPLPETYHHPLWLSWDLALEMVLGQLPAMIEAEDRGESYEYQHSNFFTEQLTAFEIYLSHAAPKKESPTQLPVLLQVLLSQMHRLRALILLSRFLDLGPWAVNLALTIGIFPYVLKLLQSAAYELKPVMTFIWARIMAVDKRCQVDLIKENGYRYFIQILTPNANLPVNNASEHRAMCQFILAQFCSDFPQGQRVCNLTELFEASLASMRGSENPLYRQWSCLCLAKLWDKYPDAKWEGLRLQAEDTLCRATADAVPEIRASATYALATFLGIGHLTQQVKTCEAKVAGALMHLADDGSSMVKHEFLVFISHFVVRYKHKFEVVASFHLLKEKQYLLNPEAHKGPGNETAEARDERLGTDFYSEIESRIWVKLMVLSIDPHPQIAQDACDIVDWVHQSILASPALGRKVRPLLDRIFKLSGATVVATNRPPVPTSSATSTASTLPEPSLAPGHESYMAYSIRKAAGVATTLKNLTLGTHNRPTNPVPRIPEPTMMERGQAALPSRVGAPADWNRSPEEFDPASSASGSYQQAPRPTLRGFVERDLSKQPLMPLKSEIYDFSVEYFMEPQMRPNEPDEPGSEDYNRRLWRRTRNEKVLLRTQPLKEVASKRRWDNALAFFNNGNQPTKLCFHQFEDHLAVMDDKDGICIWDFETVHLLSRFSNGNPQGTRMSKAQFINEDDNALLMTGSSDGSVKLYRNYDTPGVELLTAFRVLTNMVIPNRQPSLVFDWIQGKGKLLVASDDQTVRVWNAATETMLDCIPARSSSPITSLSHDAVEGHIYAAGYADGSIRVFDMRHRAVSAMALVWRQNYQWITNVHIQRGGTRELLSGCRDGTVMSWDLRFDEPIVRQRVVDTTRDSNATMRTFDVHEHAPVFAVGASNRTLTMYKQFDIEKPNIVEPYKKLSTVEPYAPFLHSARTPISGSGLHPHRMLVAAGAWGSPYVNIWGCRGAEKERLGAPW